MLRLDKDKHLSLSEFAYLIRESITASLPDSYWISAEIAGLRINQKGHCYLELVEKKDESVIAQIRANIWAYDYKKLSLKFVKETGEFLKDGMKVLLLVSVTFHEVYGLSLNVKDIDPVYTLGEMARKKREIIARLESEGIIDLNKNLPLPLVPQRIAIVSSPAAAGYGDFITHMGNNIYGYKFTLKLFPAYMQGDEAEISIINALKDIKKQSAFFDIAVIIRGGGSQMDLSCFDSYRLASEIARSPLPVITGIGHERDDTIADMTAHTKMKTPTAVADFIISGVRSFEEKVIDCRRKLVRHSEHLLKDERHRLKNAVQELINSTVRSITGNIGKINIISYRIKSANNTYVERKRSELASAQKEIQSAITVILTEQMNKLTRIEQAIHYLDPKNILKRGYSITHFQDRVVRDISAVELGGLIQTSLYKGMIISKIEALEGYSSEAGEKTNIQ